METKVFVLKFLILQFLFIKNISALFKHEEYFNTQVVHRLKEENNGQRNLYARRSLAKLNLASAKKYVGDKVYAKYLPNSVADSFEIQTLGGNFVYGGVNQSTSLPLIISIYSEYSGFLECLWNCNGSVNDLILNSPSNTHYLFISANKNAYGDALWMRNKFETSLFQLKNRLSTEKISAFSDRLHYATASLYETGIYLPEVLQQWMCYDHNCGFDQISFKIKDQLRPLVLKRLDARSDWLPSPDTIFESKSQSAKLFTDSCSKTSSLNLTGCVAFVTNGNCSRAYQIFHAQKRGAVGVIALEGSGNVQDMQCHGSDCDLPITIPASSVPYEVTLVTAKNIQLKYQNTPSSNFFMAIDHNGKLQEVGWFLYPTMHFLAWQAQWFNYKAELETNLTKASRVISVLNHTVMQGAQGASADISLPEFSEMIKYEKIELDMTLDCPGTNDRDCPHWDHTISLKICTDYVCGLEIGRWISSFRSSFNVKYRNRWLTDITQLLPLLNGPGMGKMIRFTMTTAPWAMPWVPSLNLRLSGTRKQGDLYPFDVKPLYNSNGYKFDKYYNSLFAPIKFNVSESVKKVEVFAVITGHGSDENGCGEFCVTSHTFTVNGHNHSIKFDTAGSPLGCADQVPQGSEPNEHGTWLYGRDGWCDGQNVSPWRFDVTNDVIRSSMSSPPNVLHYQGYFQGKDPNPKKNPGVMIFASYLVFYTN